MVQLDCKLVVMFCLFCLNTSFCLILLSYAVFIVNIPGLACILVLYGYSLIRSANAFINLSSVCLIEL